MVEKFNLGLMYYLFCFCFQDKVVVVQFSNNSDRWVGFFQFFKASRLTYTNMNKLNWFLMYSFHTFYH